MKKILTLALAATLGVATLANASNEDLKTLSSVKATEKKVNITLREGLGKVRLAIMNADGKKLHQQFVKVKQDVMVPYDMSQLPAGEYQVLIESNIKEPSHDMAMFTVETKDSKSDLPLMAYGKSIDDDSFRLSVIGLEEPGVQVEIFDHKGKTIYSEKINQPEGFTKVFHLSNLTTKDVSIKVTDTIGRTKYLNL
jgi:3,4-dihydroxy-2-butanone 4-phosphate synthase